MNDLSIHKMKSRYVEVRIPPTAIHLPDEFQAVGGSLFAPFTLSKCL